MRFYIMRHAEAAQAGSDATRPLSPKGRADAVKVGEFLQRSKAPVEAIWHSTKARAIETASFVNRALGQDVLLETRQDLNPDDEVEPFFSRLQEEAQDNLLIVGHLPFVDRLLGFLVAGDEGSPVAFRTATLVALEGTFEEGFSILWVVGPDCLP